MNAPAGAPSPSPSQRIAWQPVFLTLIAVLAITARAWWFDGTPPGFNQDEASIGYDAFALLHHGIDRNGMSWPVQFVSWGSGQNALYGYLMMPFIAFGLSPVTVRLPMMLAGLLSLLLAWVIMRRLFDDTTALAATVALALSPWHVMLSRWGLESNLLPFVFLLGLLCLVMAFARQAMRWMIAAGAAFALCLYAYGTAYVSVPLFFGMALLLGLTSRRLPWKHALAGVITFIVVATPIALFIAVNTFKWDSIVIAGVTIPRLPSPPRFVTQVTSESGGLPTNVAALMQLLFTQSDGLPYNITEPYGYLYSIIGVGMGLAGVGYAAWHGRRTGKPAQALLLLWFFACLPAGFLQMPNINRINLLLVPIILGAGVALAALAKHWRWALTAGLIAYMIGFGFFARDYFTTQREKIAESFFEGALPAFSLAQQSTSKGICITRSMNMPYVFALFSEQYNPREFQRTVKYDDPNSPFRQVASYGRHTFGLDQCDLNAAGALVIKKGESLPAGVAVARSETFGYFETHILR
jgi:predicted membrane-bound mannosyltransferase